MIKAFTSLLSKPDTVRGKIELDHARVAADEVILGLEIAWTNDTSAAVEIGGVIIKLFHRGKKAASIDLIYHGRYVRIPFQKTVTMIAGVNSFHIDPGETRVESLRFITRAISDLALGSHRGELHSAVEGGTYVHSFTIQVTAENKQVRAVNENGAASLGSQPMLISSRVAQAGL